MFKLFKIQKNDYISPKFGRNMEVRNHNARHSSNLKNEIKQSWQAINKIVSLKCSSKRSIEELIFSNLTYTNNYDMGNVLNEHLLSLPINIQNPMHHSSASANFSI